MNLFEWFGVNNNKSASIAKERLQIVISHQSVSSGGENELLSKLRHEILGVINKYFDVDQDQVHVQLQTKKHHSILELNVTLPKTN